MNMRKLQEQELLTLASIMEYQQQDLYFIWKVENTISEEEYRLKTKKLRKELDTIYNRLNKEFGIIL